jgi:hypothetical protein
MLHRAGLRCRDRLVPPGQPLAPDLHAASNAQPATYRRERATCSTSGATCSVHHVTWMHNAQQVDNAKPAEGSIKLATWSVLLVAGATARCAILHVAWSMTDVSSILWCSRAEAQHAVEACMLASYCRHTADNTHRTPHSMKHTTHRRHCLRLHIAVFVLHYAPLKVTCGHYGPRSIPCVARLRLCRVCVSRRALARDCVRMEIACVAWPGVRVPELSRSSQYWLPCASRPTSCLRTRAWRKRPVSCRSMYASC